MTQEDELAAYLMSHGSGTKQEILRDLGIWNSGEIVRRLRRRMGCNCPKTCSSTRHIRTNWEESDGARYARYTLASGQQTELHLPVYRKAVL